MRERDGERRREEEERGGGEREEREIEREMNIILSLGDLSMPVSLYFVPRITEVDSSVL